jgi:methylated-DNA-[protein]-cysteine S-methyltransferase
VRATRHHYAIDGWGVGELVLSGGVVLAHELPDPTLAWDGAEPRNGGSPLVNGIVSRVREHLAGSTTGYGDLPLDLSWCTDFQTELARSLRAVSWGEIVSYGELAALAGRPGAARAAGSFCAQNRFALIVPCHRVVSSDGIGGYGSAGVELKRRLLSLEGVEL